MASTQPIVRRRVCQFWIDTSKGLGDPIDLPPLARLSLASYARHSGCTVHLYTFQRVRGLDCLRNIRLKDARAFVAQADVERWLAKGIHVAHISDLFRYRCMWKYGGWWADIDSVCLRRLPSDSPRYFQSIVDKRTGQRVFKVRHFRDPKLGRFCNSVFMVPPRDPLMSHMAKFALEAIERSPNGFHHTSKGWNKLVYETAEQLKRLGYEKYVKPPVWFAPGKQSAVTHEEDRDWFGFLLPGYKTIRKHSYVYDFMGHTAGRKLAIAQKVVLAIDPARFQPLLAWALH